GIRAFHVTGVQTCALPISERGLEAGDLVGAHGRAVDATRVLLGGGRPADDRAQRDDRRLARLRLGGVERGGQRVGVLGVAVAAQIGRASCRERVPSAGRGG